MKLIRSLCSAAATTAAVLVTCEALAQAAPIEHHVIVLDQTGSMHVPGHDNGNLLNGAPNVSTEVFDNAINAAINWLVVDKKAVAAARRAYAVYTFKDDNCCGGTQSGLVQIWPKPGASPAFGCDPNVNSADIEKTTGFCLFDDGVAGAYDDLIGVLDSLRMGKNDPNKLLGSIATGTGGASYDASQYGLGPNTPLANAFCDASERLVVVKGLQNVVFTLETDGGENFSGAQAFHACSGTADGFTDPAATSFSKPAADWGLTDGGWKSKVMRRVTRFNQPGVYPAPVAGGPSTNDAQDQTIVAKPIKSPPDDILSGSQWRVDVHFNICDTNFQSPPPCPPLTAAAAMAVAPASATTTTLVAATAKTSRSSRDQFAFSPAGSKSSVATTTPTTALAGKPLAAASTTATPTTLAATAAVASTRTQSISMSELNFFKAVGHVNAKSTFRQFVRDPAAASPVHVPKIAGDVDDSGCTDSADFRIVTQSDVYYQAAVLPNQLAIRADLNGDQWVNKTDAQIVLKNWGKGCINNPGPKPVLKY